MTVYNPFDNNLTSLQTSDLSVLRQVTEGWYIEYKRELPNASSVAKSISAFSNTHGGWLFYGIAEKSKEDAVAGVFSGIDCTQIDNSLQKIRQAVAAHINPPPHFNVKTLLGPCEDLGLGNDKAIICIQIPSSPTAPHVHRSGQIYRRVADGSEPRPENDRFILDQLFHRGVEFRNTYREWLDRDPDFSDSEKNRPYMRLLLVTDLWGAKGLESSLDAVNVRTIMNQSEIIVSGIPFDTVHTTSNGIMARQNRGRNPFELSLTWKVRSDLISEILIPLNLHTSTRCENLFDDCTGYSNTGRFKKILDEQQCQYPRVVDLNPLLNILLGIVEVQNRLMTKANWPYSYFFKARLLNVRRTVAFLDIPSVLDDFEKHGIPICLKKNVIIPPGTDPTTFVEVNHFEHVDDEIAKITFQGLSIFEFLAGAYGLPIWSDKYKDGSGDRYLEELINAGRRAADFRYAQKERF